MKRLSLVILFSLIFSTAMTYGQSNGKFEKRARRLQSAIKNVNSMISSIINTITNYDPDNEDEYEPDDELRYAVEEVEGLFFELKDAIENAIANGNVSDREDYPSEEIIVGLLDETEYVFYDFYDVMENIEYGYQVKNDKVLKRSQSIGRRLGGLVANILRWTTQ